MGQSKRLFECWNAWREEVFASFRLNPLFGIAIQIKRAMFIIRSHARHSSFRMNIVCLAYDGIEACAVLRLALAEDNCYFRKGQGSCAKLQ